MVARPRVVFFGTPRFAVPSLVALIEAGWPVAGVVTQPDRPRNRGQQISASPVKQIAETRGLPVLQPERLKDAAFLEAIRAWAPEIGVVAAYGRLLPSALLELPRLGMINVHASLLPRWRGAAPVHRAILAGDRETGVTIMRVVLALDAGPTFSRVATAIDPDETSEHLERRLSEMGAALLVETMAEIAAGRAIESPQDEAGVTYAARLERTESPISWTRPAIEIHNQIRGLHPWPLATTVIGDRRIIVRRSRVDSEDEDSGAVAGTVLHAHGDELIVAARPGAVRLLELQLEGRRPMDARAFMNGTPIHVGDRFVGPTTAAGPGASR